jgi:tRNA 2-thiouridine synthesizing protein E
MTTALSISSWHISPLSVGRHKPVSAPLDKEGYLVDLNDWSESVATELAARTGLELTQEHWQIITILRDFYRTTGVSPTMRPLVKLVRERLGQHVGNSVHLHTLFPGSPARLAAKVAGLPRPTNCL